MKVFFSEYRMVITHIGFARGSTPKLPRNLDDWKANISSKLDVIVRLVKAITTDDDEAHLPVEGSEHSIQIPAPRQEPSSDSKIMIYCEFVKPLSYITKVSTMTISVMSDIYLSSLAGL